MEADPSFLDMLWSTEGLLLILIAGLFGIFERIMDLIEELWWWLMPFVVIDQYEMAVVLRWGVYARTLMPGFRWLWPFGIEEVIKDTVVRQTSYLDVQSLTSADGKPVNISPVLVYKIGNIKRWLLEVDDAEEALHDVTYGIVDELVSDTKFSDIVKPAFLEEITDLVRDEGTTWGARIEAVKFSDRVTSKSLRLWTGAGDVEYE